VLFHLGVSSDFLVEQETGSVALNLAEVEYMAASLASYEAIWLRTLLTGLFDQELELTMIHCDNQSCIKLLENPVFHDKSKC
jgi:hypothetical protein